MRLPTKDREVDDTLQRGAFLEELLFRVSRLPMCDRADDSMTAPSPRAVLRHVQSWANEQYVAAVFISIAMLNLTKAIEFSEFLTK